MILEAPRATELMKVVQLEIATMEAAPMMVTVAPKTKAKLIKSNKMKLVVTKRLPITLVVVKKALVVKRTRMMLKVVKRDPVIPTAAHIKVKVGMKVEMEVVLKRNQNRAQLMVVKKDLMELRVTKAAPRTLMTAHIKAKVAMEKMVRVKMKVSLSLSLKVALMVEKVVLMIRRVVMEGMTQVIMVVALKM